jgi:hypothetical protein
VEREKKGRREKKVSDRWIRRTEEYRQSKENLET